MLWGRFALIMEEASCSSFWDEMKPFCKHADACFWQESTGLSCGTSRRLPSCLPLQVSGCTLRSKIQTQRFYLMSWCFLLSRMKAKDVFFTSDRSSCLVCTAQTDGSPSPLTLRENIRSAFTPTPPRWLCLQEGNWYGWRLTNLRFNWACFIGNIVGGCGPYGDHITCLACLISQASQSLQERPATEHLPFGTVGYEFCLKNNLELRST